MVVFTCDLKTFLEIHGICSVNKLTTDNINSIKQGLFLRRNEKVCRLRSRGPPEYSGSSHSGFISLKGEDADGGRSFLKTALSNGGLAPGLIQVVFAPAQHTAAAGYHLSGTLQRA